METSSFDLHTYRCAKERAVALIKSTHDWERTEGFLADGVICPEKFAKEPIRIACILGESYGYDECGMVDLERQSTDDLLGVGSPRRQTAKRLPALLWLLTESQRIGRPLKWEEFPELLTITPQHTAMLQDALSRVAWVNVKKASLHIDNWGDDATRQNDAEIYAAALKNKEILACQLDSIAPHLIITCSKPVFNGLCDTGLLGGGISKGQKGVLQTNTRGQKVIELSHPGYHADWGYEGIFRTYNITKNYNC